MTRLIALSLLLCLGACAASPAPQAAQPSASESRPVPMTAIEIENLCKIMQASDALTARDASLSCNEFRKRYQDAAPKPDKK